MRVTTHRGFIHGDFTAASFYERFEFAAHDWQKRLSQSEAIRILRVRQQTSTQRVRTGDACLQSLPLGCEPNKPLKIHNRSQSTRRTQRANDLVFASLV